MILSKKEIFLKKNKEMSLTKEKHDLVDALLTKHSNKYDFFNVKNRPNKIGQHFLYEIFKDYKKNDNEYFTVTYPQLGIYLNSYPCDQTIEIEWVNYRRTWEWNIKMSEHCWVAEEKSFLQSLPLWGDQMMIYGVWDKMPNWNQLKQSYEKTWWFHREESELRDIQLNRILNVR
jgi:hypothetical protein